MHDVAYWRENAGIAFPVCVTTNAPQTSAPSADRAFKAVRTRNPQFRLRDRLLPSFDCGEMHLSDHSPDNLYLLDPYGDISLNRNVVVRFGALATLQSRSECAKRP